MKRFKIVFWEGHPSWHPRFAPQVHDTSLPEGEQQIMGIRQFVSAPNVADERALEIAQICCDALNAAHEAGTLNLNKAE